MKEVVLLNHNKVIGVAKFYKKNGRVKVVYDKDEIHYADEEMHMTEFDDYKRRMQIITEYDIGQQSLFN